MSYLEGGASLFAARMVEEDAVSGEQVVPVGASTDGDRLWNWSLAFYARRYGIAPDEALVAKAVTANGQCPPVSPERRDELLRSAVDSS